MPSGKMQWCYPLASGKRRDCRVRCSGVIHLFRLRVQSSEYELRMNGELSPILAPRLASCIDLEWVTAIGFLETVGTRVNTVRLSEELVCRYKELLFRHRGECWWHVPGRSLDSGLRALNSDDELREMCFMAEKNDGLVDVYFERAVSSSEILERNEIVVYVEGDHDELRVVSDEPDNEPLPDKFPNQTNIPIVPADETPFSNNNEPMHNTSPPKSTEPTDLGANDPTPQKNNPTTTSNSNPSQATIAKPISKTSPVTPKSKLNSKAKPNPKSNTTSSFKPKANPKNASKPKPNPNSVSKSKVNPKPKTTTKAYCTMSTSRVSKLEKCEAKKRDSKLKHAPVEALAKSKRKFINNDDALVVDDEECEVDLSFLEVPVTGDEDMDNALDHGAESDGANSWHSEKMKTLPPSEDEFYEEDPNDLFQVFRDSIQFGMPCVHAYAALARVNKRPKDFCHKWLTMDAYGDTYAHYINPLPGQSLWEKSEQNRPQAPKTKKKTEPLIKKRRKDANESNGRSKKSKMTGTLKRQLKPFTCRYCLEKGHTKRGCPKKRAADVAQALAAAAAAVAAAKTKPNAQGNVVHAPTQAPPDAPAYAPPEAPAQAPPEAPAQTPAPIDAQVVEIDLSQPNYSDAQQSQHRSTCEAIKLQTRRRLSPPPSGPVTMDPLQGASSTTSFRLANFLKFVPTPDFKPPRKKK
ncbi:hypothetical protein Ahy_B05g079703 [Arachis hypogaea]|uniref:PB1-like domain-containing protein n=1 Tax=Arachis hypogaea TaxID=3818 RepID=A0A444ZAN2_ARAHY|nr:hypothetical protein Ahy_B05g079703 [Arachis hypogaea]